MKICLPTAKRLLIKEQGGKMETTTINSIKKRKVVDYECVPEGSMTVEEFGNMLKEGIREYYAKKKSDNFATSKG